MNAYWADWLALIEQRGLTHAELTPMIGVDPRTIRRWSAGDRAVPGHVVELVRLKTGVCPHCGVKAGQQLF